MMGKTNAAAVHRARKKHEKEQKRKRATASKQQGTPARSAELTPSGPELMPPNPEPETNWRPVIENIERLAARLTLPFYEAAYIAFSPLLTDVSPDRRGKHPDTGWTRAKMAALETEDITARLEDLGVRTSRDAFIAMTPWFGSAAQVARDAWFPLVQASVDVCTDDFLTFAACELWKRWRPEVPSQEMLLEQLFLGEIHRFQEDDLTAVEQWIRFWSMFQPLLTPEMRGTEDADALLDGGEGLFFDWVCDFSETAVLVAARDPALGRRAAAVQGAVIAQFSEASQSWRLDLIVDHASTLYDAGERVEAERILRRQIDVHPTSAAAYFALSDLWAPPGCTDPASLARALTVMEEAAAQGVEHARDWDLALRIEELRALLRPR